MIPLTKTKARDSFRCIPTVTIAAGKAPGNVRLMEGAVSWAPRLLGIPLTKEGRNWRRTALGPPTFKKIYLVGSFGAAAAFLSASSRLRSSARCALSVPRRSVRTVSFGKAALAFSCRVVALRYRSEEHTSELQSRLH